MSVSRMLLGAAVVIAAAASGGRPLEAESFYDPYVLASDGSVNSPRIDVVFPGRASPPRARLVLVESGVPIEEARRRVVRLDRRAAMPSTLGGRVVGYLAPETTYDVFVLDARLGVPTATFPRGFTAHRPRFAEMPTTAGARRSSTYETYEIANGRTTLFGRTTAVNSWRYAGRSFTVGVPADVSTLQLPVTFTEADGASVFWANKRRRGAWMPGPRGLFSSSSCTVTIDSLVDGRIRGTFSAHLVHVSDDAFATSGDPFDVSDGRFSVDPTLPRFERYVDPYGVR